MKIVYTALMAIIFFTACNTEIAEPSIIQLPDDPEQLKALLADQQDEKIKLEIYYALYKIYKQSDVDLADYYLIGQRDLAESLGDELTAGKASYNRGLLCYKTGDYIAAVDSYLKAIHYFERMDDITKIGSVLNNLGVIFIETGNFEYAIKFYQKAKKIHALNQDVRRQMLANYNLGICYFSQKEADFVTAEKYLDQAKQQAESLDERRGYYLNKIHSYIGAMHYKKGDFAKAKNAYLESTNFIDPTENYNQLKFMAYSNVGEAEMGAGNYKAAHEWMEKAMAFAEAESLDAGLMISSYNIMGKLFQLEERYTESVEALETAITLADNNIINEPLQETLRIIRVSYKGLNNMGRAVSANRYDNILEIDGKQDKLEKDLAENINFQALQTALGLSIELDHQRKKNRAETEEKTVFIIIAILLAMLAGGVAYRLRSTKFELSQAGNRLRLIKHIAKHDSL